MAQFNPNEYETVNDRIQKFYKAHPNGRIVTDLIAADGGAGSTRWIVRAAVFRDVGYELPDATGYAYEIDGVGGPVNRTSALENAETSAVGRALANLGLSGEKRPTREEMEKTERMRSEAQVDERAVQAAVRSIQAAEDVPALQEAWNAAGKSGVAGDVRVTAAKDAQLRKLKGAR